MLLAIDTSTTRAGIALYDGEVVAEAIWLAGRDHGRHLMPVIDQTMCRLGLKPNNLTAVAAARGPGSFTGLRVGLAVARGLQVGLGIPLYGVGSLEVLANGLPPLEYPIWAVLTAGRRRYATAKFSWSGRGYVQETAVVGVDLASLLRLVEERCAIVGDLDADMRDQLVQHGRSTSVVAFPSSPAPPTPGERGDYLEHLPLSRARERGAGGEGVRDLDADMRDQLASPGTQIWIAPPSLSVRRPAVLAELAWHKLHSGVGPEADAGEPIYLVRG